MDKQWYYAHDGSAVGPFSKAALRDMAEAGIVPRDTLVWKAGMADWTPIGQVEGFKAHAAQAPPPVPAGTTRQILPVSRARDDEAAAKTMYIASCTTFAILASLMLYGLLQGGGAEGVYASHSVEGGEPVELGDTVTGILEATDELLDDSTHYDNWLYEGQAGEQIDVRLESEVFDPYLFIRAVDPDLPMVVGEDDDGGTGTNAHLQIRLPQDGTYAIVVNSYLPGERGEYTLALLEAKAE